MKSKVINVVFPLLLLVVANKVVSQGATTTFTFNRFSTITDHKLIFQGDAFVPSSSSFARLTKINCSDLPARSSIGRVVYSPPVNFWDDGLQASFETTIRFTIKPVNTIPGDGITFFIAPVDSPIPPGSTAGSLGLFNPSTGLAPSVFAVEFDPASNPWDPRYQHIGIDINSRASKKTTRFKVAVGKEVTAHINYHSSTRTITVLASHGPRGSVNTSVSYVFDLKTILPKQVQVGISSTTGSWIAFHDLHSWYFSSTLVWDGNNLDKPCIQQYV